MNRYSGKVLSWRVSTTMDTRFCLDALVEAIENYGCPEIFKTDQGSKFTSDDFTSEIKKNKIQISMDGKGRRVGDVIVKRILRSVKYEDVYLKAYDTVVEARESVGKYFEFYNYERRHQTLDKQAPDKVYN